MRRETWYVLEDGSVVDPRDVAPDDAGALRHISGVAVAMKGQVPHSRGVDLDEVEVREPAELASESESETEAGSPPAKQKKKYKNRELKSE